MKIENEHYYRNELENAIKVFVSHLDDHPFGMIPDNLSVCMAEAAFAVLLTVRDVNDYMEREKPEF